MIHRIVLLPGDGVGPEVTAVAHRVLDAAADRFGHAFTFDERPVGGAAIDACGDPLPPHTLKACLAADAVFLGAVGGPKWGTGGRRPEEGLLALRAAMGLYANLRPVKVDATLAGRSPLKREAVEGVDLLIVRELTGGLYFGERTRTPDRATDLCVYTAAEVERVAHAAFRAARGRRGHVTSVDKANVLETSRLWRETVTRVAPAYPDVALEHALVDSTAMQLILRPATFDVILTENMFGDILSDEASVLAGTIGLLGSASLGEPGRPGLFEPIHGSAPDIAGRGLADPLGAVRAAAMLLDALHLPYAARAVEAAATRVIGDGVLTPDLGGDASTDTIASHLVDAVRATAPTPT